MKERIQHSMLILLALLIVVGGISAFFNNASYNPDFSVIDAISGATKKSHHDKGKSDATSVWGYSKDDLALSGENYTEEIIKTAGKSYKVLKNTVTVEKRDDLILLSDKGNEEYQKAVENISGYLMEQGYHVRIKECSETMLLSFVHAGRFDLFLMSEEATQ